MNYFAIMSTMVMVVTLIMTHLMVLSIRFMCFTSLLICWFLFASYLNPNRNYKAYSMRAAAPFAEIFLQFFGWHFHFSKMQIEKLCPSLMQFVFYFFHELFVAGLSLFFIYFYILHSSLNCNLFYKMMVCISWTTTAIFEITLSMKRCQHLYDCSHFA